jgi:protein-tyrosine phosphatase
MTEQIAVGHIELGEDFSQHRITGYVPHAADRGMDPNLDVPLVSHVEGNLYQGGCMGGVRLPDGFKHVVSLYPWEQYVLPEGCERVEYKMYDALSQGFDQVDEIAFKVVEFCGDGPTLVHCQAGLNRSGLIAARALVIMGFEPVEAINKLRAGRSRLVLCNEAFENWIWGL